MTTAKAGEPVSYFRHDRGIAAGSTAALPHLFDASELVWKTELPPGNSTPCVYGQRIFLTTFESETQALATVALDRKTGRRLWRRAAPIERLESFHPVGSPASSTPACDGQRLYVFFGSLGLLCYDLDGELLWQKPMGPFQDEFGAVSSPVLVDDKIILNEDHDVDSFIAAIDNKTGETLWKTARPGFTRSYSTPILWRSGDSTQVLIAGALQLAAYDAQTGEKLWWVNGLSRILDTTPTLFNDRLYLATWTPGGDTSSRIKMESFQEALDKYDRDGDGQVAQTELEPGAVLTRFFRIDLNQDRKLNREEWEAHARVFEQAQNVALAVRLGGKGDVTQSHVDWIFRRGLPTVPSPLVYDGVMYMVKDGGIITALEAATGKVVKQGRARGPGNYYASPVAGDGKVYFCSERGVVTVLRAGGEWEILAARDFGQRIMATPVIHQGEIYLRTDAALHCFRQK